jgi:uncharacterized protein
MRLGIISDTHGDVVAWRQAVRQWGKVDFVIHAGDVNYHGPKFAVYSDYDPKALSEEINGYPAPVLIARGNGDAEVDELVLDVPLANPYLFCQLEGLRILVHHGHRISGGEAVELAKKFGCRLIITGHTHRSRIEEIDGLLVLNPGSAAYGDKTAAIVRVTDSLDLIPEIIDL